MRYEEDITHEWPFKRSQIITHIHEFTVSRMPWALFSSLFYVIREIHYARFSKKSRRRRTKSAYVLIVPSGWRGYGVRGWRVIACHVSVCPNGVAGRKWFRLINLADPSESVNHFRPATLMRWRYSCNV